MVFFNWMPTPDVMQEGTALQATLQMQEQGVTLGPREPIPQTGQTTRDISHETQNHTMDPNCTVERLTFWSLCFNIIYRIIFLCVAVRPYCAPWACLMFIHYFRRG